MSLRRQRAMTYVHTTVTCPHVEFQALSCEMKHPYATLTFLLLSVAVLGYGDISPKYRDDWPQNDIVGCVFAIIWIFLGTLYTAKAIGGVLDDCFARKQRKSAEKIVATLRALKLQGIRRVQIRVISGLLNMSYPTS